jgi:predicted  nucleic acid-binding Zn-ribbon protein
MPVDVEALQGELAAHKKRAGDLSSDLMRAQKAIGERDNKLEEMAALQAANDQLKSANADLASQLKAADKALAAANKLAADNAVKIEAANQIKAGLAAL